MTVKECDCECCVKWKSRWGTDITIHNIGKAHREGYEKGYAQCLKDHKNSEDLSEDYLKGFNEGIDAANRQEPIGLPENASQRKGDKND